MRLYISNGPCQLSLARAAFDLLSPSSTRSLGMLEDVISRLQKLQLPKDEHVEFVNRETVQKLSAIEKVIAVIEFHMIVRVDAEPVTEGAIGLNVNVFPSDEPLKEASGVVGLEDRLTNDIHVEKPSEPQKICRNSVGPGLQSLSVHQDGLRGAAADREGLCICVPGAEENIIFVDCIAVMRRRERCLSHADSNRLGFLFRSIFA